MSTPLSTQVGGNHYKSLPIQPTEFCQRNQLGWCESNVVKYVARHRHKNGRQDIEKAIHYLQILLEIEYPEQQIGTVIDQGILISALRKARERIKYGDPKILAMEEIDLVLNLATAKQQVATVTSPPSDIPEELLPLPPIPDGYVSWIFRGLGYRSDEPVMCAVRHIRDGQWIVWGSKSPAQGNSKAYYLEAV